MGKAGHKGTRENSTQAAEITNVEVENVHNHTVRPNNANDQIFPKPVEG